MLIPTILCGGAGSRLWPVSRELHPKPFMRLADGQSLLQKAFLRGAVLPEVGDVLTITNRELSFKTRDDYAEVNTGHLPSTFVLEPFGRNTAPAIAAAALVAASKHGDDAILLVLPADHLIHDQAAFGQSVATAMTLARESKLVTFGIRPETPETGYGYIEADGHRVLRFVEKPGLQKAEEYLAAGNFLWNSGMFCFTAATMLAQMKLHCPELLTAVETCLAQSLTAEAPGFAQTELHADSFAAVPDISIDYAVMEKSADIAVVPCSIGWSDVGSWSAISELVAEDAQQNRVDGQAMLHDVSNCFIQSRDRLVAAVGVDNLVIIDTPDALLVADKERSQEVKHIYAALKAQGNEAYKLHRTVHRPWGTYTVLEEGPRFKIKRIVVNPGASLSLQMHHHRSEHWVVVSGTARVVNGEREMMIHTDESTYIPAGHKHRLSNPGLIDLVMIEVQSGEYLGEDDIVRFDDRYGRDTKAS